MNDLRIIRFIVLIITLCSYTIYCQKKKDEILNDSLKILTGKLNEKINLYCGHTQSIHILDASYGNPSVDNILIKKNSLDAPHTIPVVQMMCEGKHSCEIHVNDETFKILSVIKDFHKLIIKYVCKSTELKTFPAYNVKARRGGDNIWNVEFQDETLNKERYLHVNDISAICEKPLLKKKYVHINEAEHECNNLINCVFIVFNYDTYTLCESSSYKNAIVQKNSRIYIKMSYISGHLPQNYGVFPNVQGVCEKNNVLYEINSAFNLDDIYEKCKEINCDYFTMSTANGLKGASKKFRNHAWFCKGYPKYVSHEGFIFGKNNKKDLNK
ncbi:hypothetical protein, conserved [Plasmodium gonderi]|uniref:SUEL-type lectin domain-containing protein n=1 Tax=Plasmodium gonderi TaxID=77519 RepID=A0A1Y1JIE8_PLAGO|nr:hypothetical protein, conserved [Plasmodium gonderi]GAW82291.1 hypothetical protein, conserved [Plasmodium gonderi]